MNKFIRTLAYIGIAIVESTMGIHWYGWQFWAILFLVGIIDITSFLDAFE